MAVLNIAGKSVTVDDSFLKMAPDQQNAAVDEIAKSIGIGATGSAPQQPPPAQPTPQDAGQFIPGAEGMPPLPSGASPNRTQDTGGVRAADDTVRALANGMTFGLADRAAAGMGAATGVGGTQGDYAGNLKQQRAQTAASTVPNGILNFVGSAAVPIGAFGAAAKGASLATKVLLGGAAGSVLGGVQGAASSPDWTNTGQTAWDTGKGALLGLGFGGALPVAGAGLGAAYNKAADLFTGGIPGISRAGANHLVSAVQADTPQAVQAALNQYGPQAMLADAGPALLGKTQGAALNSDAAKSVVVNALKQRDIGTNGRVMGDVESALGPAEDPQTVTNAIKATRSAADNTNYTKALGNAPPVDTTDILTELGPAIGNSVGMENKALTNLRGMLMTEKPVPRPDPITGQPMTDERGNIIYDMKPEPQTNAAILHKVKGELDNVIQYDQPGLGVPAGALSRQQGALKQFRGALNNTLEQQVPGYAEANAASSALAKRGEAVEAGTQMLSSGKTTPSPERFATEFGQKEPGEQIAFAKGTRGDIARLLGTKINDLQALKGSLQGEGGWNAAKLATMYGQPTTDQLTGTVERNLKFRDTFNKVVENSQTAQRNAAAGAMKPQPPGDMPLINPNMSLTGFIGAGAKKAADAVLGAMRSNPTASYGDVGRVLTAQGPERDAAFQAIKDAIARRSQNASAAPKIGDRAALVAAILANGQMRNRLQAQ